MEGSRKASFFFEKALYNCRKMRYNNKDVETEGEGYERTLQYFGGFL